MVRIHKWSVMISGSMQAEFMETQYNSHIHGYGTSVLTKEQTDRIILLYVISIDNLNVLG